MNDLGPKICTNIYIKSSKTSTLEWNNHPKETKKLFYKSWKEKSWKI